MSGLSEIKRIMLSLSDEEIIRLLGIHKRQNDDTTIQESCKWMDKPISGLDKDGLRHLKELESDSLGNNSHIDKKQLRYLRILKNIRMEVPPFFKEIIEPKQMYKDLKSFCLMNDIPDEIISKVIPSLINYIETGYFRPMIFVGEKGCGKTTAARMIVEKALKIPTEIIKAPQTDGGHGMTGDCGVFQSADAGYIAKARIKYKTLIIAYIVDEIDKVTHDRNRANIDDELLSITDESNDEIIDNYTEVVNVALNHCPIIFTANDLQKVNPILVDRCTVINFPDASASRIKSIIKKFTDKKLESSLYGMIDLNYEIMFDHVDHLVNCSITSLRKHQQMVEIALNYALETSLDQENNTHVLVTEEMFSDAEQTILGTVKNRVGF